MKLVNGSDFNESRFQLRIYNNFWRKHNMCMWMIIAIQFHDNIWSKSNGNIILFTPSKRREREREKTKTKHLIVVSNETLCYFGVVFAFQIEMMNWHNTREHQCALWNMLENFPPKKWQKNWLSACRHMKCLCESSEIECFDQKFRWHCIYIAQVLRRFFIRWKKGSIFFKNRWILMKEYCNENSIFVANAMDNYVNLQHFNQNHGFILGFKTICSNYSIQLQLQIFVYTAFCVRFAMIPNFVFLLQYFCSCRKNLCSHFIF